MQLVALDGTKLLVLMAAGGLFAAAGLWLIFRPKPQGGAAKLELLGMKFESSSAGVLVFLIGAGFLATPLLVEERAPAGPVVPVAPAEPAGKAAGGAPGTAPVGAPRPASPAAEVPRRLRADGKEREPNDDYDDANQIAVGDSVRGRVENMAEDWYVMPVDASAASLFFKIRNVSDRYGAWQCSGIHFYSGDEVELGEPIEIPETKTVSRYELDTRGASTVFVRVAPCGEIEYEIFTGYAPIE